MIEYESLIETWQFWTGFTAFAIFGFVGLFLRSRESDPILEILVGFKYQCIGFGLFLLLMMFAMPPTSIWMLESLSKVESFQDVSRFQRQMGSDLHRLREILQYSLQLAAFWLFGSSYAVVAFIKREREKNKTGV